MPLEAPAKIQFSGTEVRTDGKKQYGVYVIQCQSRAGEQWSCEKRYSEFDALRKALIKDKCDKVKQLENLPHGKGKFPKKGGKSVDPEVMKVRKEGLNTWLNSVMKFYGENLNVCAFFKEVAAIKRDVGLAPPPEGVPPPVEPVRPPPPGQHLFTVSDPTRPCCTLRSRSLPRKTCTPTQHQSLPPRWILVSKLQLKSKRRPAARTST
jgi:hypothetical protein